MSEEFPSTFWTAAVPLTMVVLLLVLRNWDGTAVLAIIGWAGALYAVVTWTFFPAVWLYVRDFAGMTYFGGVLVGSALTLNVVVYVAGFGHPFFFKP